LTTIHRLYSRSPKTLFALAGLLLIIGFLGWRYFPSRAADVAANSAEVGKRQGKGPAPIPVTIQPVQKHDFQVYLNGLGTVQPYDTVTVRSRVDGQVIKVDFRQGQMVNKGDLLVQIDPRPYQAALEQAQAKKAQDEANLKNAQLDLKRYSTLAQQEFATRQQLDTQQATVDQLIAQIKGDQANIDNTGTQLSYTDIRSPLTGKTGFRLVDPGNIVHASDTSGIVTIVKLQPISVVFTAPEEEIGKINNALGSGVVPVMALTSDGTKVLAQGHLALVNNEVDQASGTIRMKATFQNTDNALWPGLSVATRLLVNTRKNAIVVSSDAIEHGQNGLYAFVVGDENKVEIKEIKVSDEDATRAVVTEGLAVGDRVVVAGQYRLTQGVVVDPRETNAPPSPADKEASNTSQKVP
jgi:multidrug efflux system membrane fusion protein